MKALKVLVACEFSGMVRDAFAALGHEAWSCDLIPPETPGNHHTGDALKFIASRPWDLLIAHPPCTRLSVSGARWLTDHWVKKKTAPGGRYWFDGSENRIAFQSSIDFFMALWNSGVPMIAIENPVGRMSTVWRRPDQTIQPWQFGHPESKATCLWLKNLPKLIHTNVLQKPADGRWDNQTASGQNKLTPGPTRAQERSRTYAGIASAMAHQWSNP